MDRLFLDANVLFSAAYRANSGLVQLWKLSGVTLCSSHYALEEARVNLAENSQRRRLAQLARRLRLFDATPRALPFGLSLPEKDVPIFLAAMEAHATHLITGDIRHFGSFFGSQFEGVLMLTPSEYLKSRHGQ